MNFPKSLNPTVIFITTCILSLAIFNMLSSYKTDMHESQVPFNHDRYMDMRGNTHFKVDPNCKGIDYIRRWPNAILIGEKKTGTTAMQVFLSALTSHIKFAHGEPHFFDRFSNFKKGFKYYLTLMPESCPGDITMEKTPSYFRNEIALERIYTWNPNLKLLLSLRDPVKRAISDWYHMTRKGEKGFEQFLWYANNSFQEVVINKNTGEINESSAALQRSFYDVNMESLLKFYSLNQIHIIDSEVFARSPVEELKKVEAFLGLKPQITESMLVYNATTGLYCPWENACVKFGYSYEPLDDTVVEQLVAYYKPHVKNLYQLIGRKLSWMDKYLDEE